MSQWSYLCSYFKVGQAVMENLFELFYLKLWPISQSQFWPQRHNLSIFDRETLAGIIYHSSGPCCISQEEFWKWQFRYQFCFTLWPFYATNWNHLNILGSRSTTQGSFLFSFGQNLENGFWEKKTFKWKYYAIIAHPKVPQVS